MDITETTIKSILNLMARRIQLFLTAIRVYFAIFIKENQSKMANKLCLWGFGPNFSKDYGINLIPFVYFWNWAIPLIDTYIDRLIGHFNIVIFPPLWP